MTTSSLWNNEHVGKTYSYYVLITRANVTHS